MMPERSAGFLRHLLGQVAEQGLGWLGLSRRPAGPSSLDAMPLADLVRLLISTRGEASGVAIARAIMTRYADESKE